MGELPSRRHCRRQIQIRVLLGSCGLMALLLTAATETAKERPTPPLMNGSPPSHQRSPVTHSCADAYRPNLRGVRGNNIR